MQNKTGSYVLLVENHEVMENSELKIMIYTLIFSILFFLSLRLRKGRFLSKNMFCPIFTGWHDEDKKI